MAAMAADVAAGATVAIASWLSQLSNPSTLDFKAGNRTMSAALQGNQNAECLLVLRKLYRSLGLSLPPLDRSNAPCSNAAYKQRTAWQDKRLGMSEGLHNIST